MFTMFKKKHLHIYAPIEGTIVSLKDVPDPIFSQKMMGDGVAINPSSNDVCAVCDGEIILLPESKHAYGIRTKEGYEILIHVGIDTVNLHGEGFTTYVNEGNVVKKGTPILSFDSTLLKERNIDSTVMIIFTNAENKEIEHYQLNFVTKEDVIYSI